MATTLHPDSENHLSWFGRLETFSRLDGAHTYTFSRACETNYLIIYIRYCRGIINPSERFFLVKVKNLRQPKCKEKTSQENSESIQVCIFSVLLLKYLPNVYKNIWNIFFRAKQQSHNYLRAWGGYAPIDNPYPVIEPWFDSVWRQAIDSIKFKLLLLLILDKKCDILMTSICLSKATR